MGITCRYAFSALKDYLLLQCALFAIGAGVCAWFLHYLRYVESEPDRQQLQAAAEWRHRRQSCYTLTAAAAVATGGVPPAPMARSSCSTAAGGTGGPLTPPAAANALLQIVTAAAQGATAGSSGDTAIGVGAGSDIQAAFPTGDSVSSFYPRAKRAYSNAAATVLQWENF